MRLYSQNSVQNVVKKLDHEVIMVKLGEIMALIASTVITMSIILLAVLGTFSGFNGTVGFVIGVLCGIGVAISYLVTYIFSD